MAEDTRTLKDAATTNVSMALRSILQAAFGIGFMFFVSWRLSCLTLLSLPLLSAAIRLYGGWIKELSKQTQAEAAVATSVASDSLGAIRTVKAFAREAAELRRYSAAAERTLSLGIRAAFAEAVFSGVFFGIALIVIVGVFW